jgi:hypothetical protein
VKNEEKKIITKTYKLSSNSILYCGLLLGGNEKIKRKYNIYP